MMKLLSAFAHPSVETSTFTLEIGPLSIQPGIPVNDLLPPSITSVVPPPRGRPVRPHKHSKTRHLCPVSAPRRASPHGATEVILSSHRALVKSPFCDSYGVNPRDWMEVRMNYAVRIK